MDQPIQVGIVGYGMSTQVFHIPFLTTNPNYRLTSVVERREQKAVADFPAIRSVRSIEELLEDESLELVLITTPNDTHAPLAKAAILAKKHVLIEKPFCVTSDEAKELQALAKEQGVYLTVYHNRRFDGDFLTVRSLISQKLLGEVVEFESHFDRFRPNLNKQAWREAPQKGSGILYDLGSHLIDQVLLLFGEPEAVQANLSMQREGARIDDAFTVTLWYPKVKATLRAGMLIRIERPRYALYGTEGAFIKYGLDPQEQQLKDGMLPTEQGFGIETSPSFGTVNTSINGIHLSGNVETIKGNYSLFYEQVYRAIRYNEPLPVTAEEAARVIKAIELAARSHQEQRTLPWG